MYNLFASCHPTEFILPLFVVSIYYYCGSLSAFPHLCSFGCALFSQRMPHSPIHLKQYNMLSNKLQTD